MTFFAIDAVTKRPRSPEVDAAGQLKIAGTFSAAPAVGGATEAKQDVGNAYLADLAVPRTAVNRSGTIATGGASQALLSTDSARRGVLIMNNSAGSLWINDLGAAAVLSQPALEIKPGAYFETPPNYDCRQAWAVIGATTGQAFTAREF